MKPQPRKPVRANGDGIEPALRRVFVPAAGELPSTRAFGPWWLGTVVVLSFVVMILGLELVLPKGALTALLLELGILLVIGGFTIWYTARSGRARPAPLSSASRRHWIAIGALALVATVVVAGGLLHLVLPQELRGIGHKLPGSDEGRVIAFFTMVVLAPPLEELVFRGWFLRSLQTVAAPSAAILISGTVFGLLHIWLAKYTPGMGLEIVAVGYVLGYLCLHSGSMIPNVAAHMTLNFTAFFSVVYHPISELVTIVLLLAAAISTVRWLRRQRKPRGLPTPAAHAA
jgi:membrane protease YdiL (CAAX protease family)